MNGKLTWIQTSTNNALWWSSKGLKKGYWIIGKREKIGSSVAWLYNPVSWYGNDNDWFYYNGAAWVNPIGEINVDLECTTGSGK